MNDLIAYLLKVSAGTMLLYLCFVFFFRKDTFYLRNRIILILTILLPVLLPLFRVEGFVRAPVAVSVIHSVITVGTTFTGQVNTFDYNGLIITVWLCIAGLILLRTIVGLIKTVSIIRKGALCSDNFPKLVISDLDLPPFSFWPYAVIPRKILDKGEAEDIIIHENAHIRQGHTFDLIASEVYTALFWFNPASWLIKRSIRLNHEFLADHELTRHSADIKNYQYKLLAIPEEFYHIQLAHSFNNLTKNRIVMINKKQTSDYAAWKNLLIIPAVALIFAAFSCNNNPASTKDSANGQTSVRKLTEIKIEKPVESKQGEKIFAQVEQILQQGEEIFTTVDQQPIFPGGEKAMMEFIFKELKYPVIAQETGVQGTVIMGMVIDSKGKIKDVKVLRGIPALNAEAIRMLNSMPDWEPGKKGGKAVSVSYTIPLKFILN